MNVLHLNEYVILKIFEYCDDRDLENLYEVCDYFRNIIENRIYYVKSLNLLLCGHNNDPINCRRTFSDLSYRERLKITNNWIDGRYTERVCFNHNKFYSSKIYLDKDNFYMTHTGMLRIHKRIKYDDAIERRIFREIGTPYKTDISDFRIKNNQIFAGRINGICFLYNIHSNELNELRLHLNTQYLMSVEFLNNIYVISTDKTCRIWYGKFDDELDELDLREEYNENFKCLDILPNSQKIIGGKYVDSKGEGLKEIDIETGTIKTLNSNTLSIYDVKHKDENIILTAHFDTTFRLFDRRTNYDELIWTDPYDSSIYCLEHDGLYGVLCGMKYNCRVNLYDIRISKKFVQMYFPLRRDKHTSPVYSITCDCRYLFLATDHNLRIWDFKSSWAKSRDYRDIFVNV